MSHKAKNILIVFLVIVVVVLTWMLFIKDSGQYCKTIIRQVPRVDSIK